MVSLLLKHTKVRVKAVRVKQPCSFAASWGKHIIAVIRTQSMLSGDRLINRNKSSETLCPPNARKNQFLKHSIVHSGKKNQPNVQVFFQLSSSSQCLVAWNLFPLCKLAKFPHNCEMHFALLSLRLICFNRRKLLQRYLNWPKPLLVDAWTGKTKQHIYELYMLVNFLRYK